MKRIALIAALILITGFLVLPARASGNCDGLSTCTDDTGFDTADSWNSWHLVSDPASPPSGTVTWLASKSFGALWWQTDASGVLALTPHSAALAKTIHLTPGNYQIAARLAADGISYVRLSLGAANGTFDLNGAGLSYISLQATSDWKTLNSYTNGNRTITVLSPGDVTLRLETDNAVTTYLDDIYILRASDATPYPSATPLPGHPTATLTTPTVTQPAATPVPAGTAYCQEKPDTSGLPSYNATPIPTDQNWGVYDGFSQTYDATWSAANGAATNWDVGHNAAPSVSIPNAPTGTTGATLSQPAIVYSRAMPVPFYIDLWANADFVPVGVTQLLEVWVKDSGGTWYLQSTATVGHGDSGAWYPLHFAVSAPGGSTGSIVAVALAASRSDSSSAHYVDVDEIYVYGNLTLAGYCGGGLPSTVTNADQSTSTYVDGYTLSVPADKPCPPSVDRPNNFWGYLLSGVTIFMDQMFAQAPYHSPGSLTIWVKDIAMSPLLGMFTFLAILLDWTIPLRILLIMGGMQIIYSALLAWKFVRRATIE